MPMATRGFGGSTGAANGLLSPQDETMWPSIQSPQLTASSKRSASKAKKAPAPSPSPRQLQPQPEPSAWRSQAHERSDLTPKARPPQQVQKLKDEAKATELTMSPASKAEAAHGDVLTDLPQLQRVTALSRAESEDFASAEPSTPVSLTRSASVSSASSHDVVAREAEEAERVETASASTTASTSRVGPKDFELLCVIGQGAFGKVIQVRHKPSGEILAMKIVSNKYIVQKNSIAYLQAERDIMTKVNHPFLIRLRYAFQTTSNVYLVMPFIAGGELFHHLHKEGLLLEDAARFYAAEMVLALEHLHGLGIIHRDLKPENVLLDGDGHIRLTDFGLAKEMANAEDSASTMCGTNEYMAPEMIRGKAYNQAVDWWALGALIYEMVTGYPPFTHKNRKKLHHKILNEKLSLPKWLASETHSILKQLLERNVDKRLGSGKSTMFQVRGVQAIKKHAFFKGIDWRLLEQKKITPPIVPVIKSNTDTSYFSEEFTSLAVGRPSRVDSAGASDAKLFARFSFCADEEAPDCSSEVCKEMPALSLADSAPAIQNGVC